MRISTEYTDTTTQNDKRQADQQKPSDRFSRMLKNKKGESEDKRVGSKRDGYDTQTKNSSVCPDLQPPNSSGMCDSSASPLQSLASSTAKAVSSPSIPPQIDELATEISHQIDVLKQGGKTEGINITFDSQALEGLQVQIRPQNGEMAIRFVTKSHHISHLLSEHTGELREALTSKGVKIRNITISSNGTPVIRRNGYAGI